MVTVMPSNTPDTVTKGISKKKEKKKESYYYGIMKEKKIAKNGSWLMQSIIWRRKK